jgi:1-acyl-sn-glycerol-3-phosphate acyltransferase
MNRRPLTVLRTLFGWRVRAENVERVPRTPVIIAANHQSYLDPVELWLAAAPRITVGMVGVANPGVVAAFAKVFGGWMTRWLGMLPVDRTKPGAAVEGAAEQIASGKTVGIFPEGTRNRVSQDRLLPAKTGVARLALLTGVPIIPAGIIAPPGLTTGQALRNFLFSRKPAVVRFGFPIQYPRTPAEQWTPELLNRVVEDVMRAISALSGRTYTPRSPKIS